MLVNVCRIITAVRGSILWNCTFVANGASCDDLNDRFRGMRVAGSDPAAANKVRLRAVMTFDESMN